jgi:hypothetical protein
MTGAVDTFKQSYGVYKAMAQTGAGLETYQYYMPVITKGEIVAP